MFANVPVMTAVDSVFSKNALATAYLKQLFVVYIPVVFINIQHMQLSFAHKSVNMKASCN